ncbi:MAG TPA: STAS domain-containing protein [Gammaproteobacteria bacterium]
MSQVNSHCSTDGRAVTIRVGGRFDFSLHRDFREAYRAHPRGLSYSVDLSATEYLDSSALGMLLLLREHAGGDQARVEIRGVGPDVRKLLEIARFDRLFSIR